MKSPLFVLMSVTALLTSTISMAQAHGGIFSLDSNGDGQISREEFQPPKHRGGPKMFKHADADGDGELTRDEMLAAVDAAGERQAQMPQLFDAMDTDGNGVVSPVEAEDHAFRRMDASGDGFISEDEAKAMHEKRGQRRKPHSRPDSARQDPARQDSDQS